MPEHGVLRLFDGGLLLEGVDLLPRLDALVDGVHGENDGSEFESGVRHAALQLGVPLGHHAQPVDGVDLLLLTDDVHNGIRCLLGGVEGRGVREQRRRATRTRRTGEVLVRDMASAFCFSRVGGEYEEPPLRSWGQAWAGTPARSILRPRASSAAGTTMR